MRNLFLLLRHFLIKKTSELMVANDTYKGGIELKLKLIHSLVFVYF